MGIKVRIKSIIDIYLSIKFSFPNILLRIKTFLSITVKLIVLFAKTTLIDLFFPSLIHKNNLEETRHLGIHFYPNVSYVLCSRRFSKGQVAYCNIFKHGRIVAGEKKKKKREAENVGAFIMKLRNCKLSKYNGRAPALVQVWIFFLFLISFATL